MGHVNVSLPIHREPARIRLHGKAPQETPLGRELLHAAIAKLGRIHFVILADRQADAGRELALPVARPSPREQKTGRSELSSLVAREPPHVSDKPASPAPTRNSRRDLVPNSRCCCESSSFMCPPFGTTPVSMTPWPCANQASTPVHKTGRAARLADKAAAAPAEPRFLRPSSLFPLPSSRLTATMGIC